MSAASGAAAMTRPLRRAGIGRLGVWAISGVAWLVLAALIAPLAVLIGASFSASGYVHFPPQGLSLAWYGRFFKDPTFLDALLLSAEIATAASLLATILGFPAAYVLVRRRFPGQRLAWGAFLAPLLVPQIVIGISLLQFFTLLGIATSFVGLLIAHVVAVMPYVIRTVGAALVSVDVSVEEAAADLGATRLEMLVLIVAPMIKSGLLAGALFAFIMSWVNVEISIFLSVTGGYTLPVVLFNFMEYSITPVIVAAASIAIYVAVALVVIIDRAVGVHTASRL